MSEEKGGWGTKPKRRKRRDRRRIYLLLTDSEADELGRAAVESGAGSRNLIIAEALRAGMRTRNLKVRQEKRRRRVDAWVPHGTCGRWKNITRNVNDDLHSAYGTVGLAMFQQDGKLNITLALELVHTSIVSLTDYATMNWDDVKVTAAAPMQSQTQSTTNTTMTSIATEIYSSTTSLATSSTLLAPLRSQRQRSVPQLFSFQLKLEREHSLHSDSWV